ncbi:MAG: hypothetical protein GX201_11410 [Clostridiales bacterium]|nr:hypothetical protein [Clostridiales bacterium]
MLFAIIVLVLWIIFAIILKSVTKDKFRFSDAILPLVLISYLLTIDLGINYVAGAIPGINDGIGLHSRFALYIIGEDNWSIELLKRIYDISFTISILLTFILTLLLIMNYRRSNI